MRILVLSFYFSPDLCAGSFRATALVDQLKKEVGVEVDVVTTMPNRYASFSAGAKTEESDGNIRIRRITLPPHENGMLDQIKSFKAFYLQARKIVKGESYDLIFATSSRLFTAYLGASIAKSKKSPLYLDIRDIFVDTIKDVLSPRIVFFLKPILSKIENHTFSTANHINLVSKGFSGYFEGRYSKANYSWFTNGIDSEFLDLTRPEYKKIFQGQVKRIVYAGNIGEGQGLHTIIPKLARLSYSSYSYSFSVIGDGGRKKQLVEGISGAKNIEILPPVSRNELVEKYLAADVLFLHLNDHPAFEKVLPSKIFEYAATGKPILAGVSGYAAEFIKSEVSNAEVFYPGDQDAALLALKKLKLEYTNRDKFIKKYNRENIMKDMADSIIKLGSFNE